MDNNSILKKIMSKSWVERAKQLMHEKGITQLDLAPVLGKETRGAVGHYFTGVAKPTLEQLTAMAKFFGVSLSYLLEGDDTDNIDNTKLQNCMKAVQSCIEKNEIDVSVDQQAKLVAYLYSETKGHKEVSVSKVVELAGFFAL
jgi:transcriptional regulator with XRE-family HTH domain